jgi:hypothetical protein
MAIDDIDDLCPQGARLTFSLQAALHQPCIEFCHALPLLAGEACALTVIFAQISGISQMFRCSDVPRRAD